MKTAEKIRALNDAARTTFQGCRVMLTVGVQQLDGRPQVLHAVRSYTVSTKAMIPTENTTLAASPLPLTSCFGSLITMTLTFAWLHRIPLTQPSPFVS